MKKLTKKGKILLSVGIVALLAVGGGVAYTQMSKDSKQSQQQYIELYTIPTIPKVFINGAIQPKTTKTYGREDAKGMMTSIQVKSGDTVKEGQWLFSYKNEGKEEEGKGIKEEISSVQVDLNDVKKKLQQLKPPANPSTNPPTEEETEGPSPEQMDYLSEKQALEAQIQDYTKQIQKLNTRLTSANNGVYTKVTAPFAGVVHLDDTKPEAAVVLDSSVFFMNGRVSEQDLVKVKVGMTSEIFIFSTKEKVKGTIESISTRPSEDSGGENGGDVSYYQVNLSFEQGEQIINGLHAQATVQLEAPPIEVPASAILDEKGKSYVFIDENGIAKKTEVKTKVEDGKYIITEGLSEKMSIVKDIIGSKVEDGSVLYQATQNGEAQNE